MSKILSVTEGQKLKVAVTTLVGHGSGQALVNPAFTMDAGITERLTFPVSDLEFEALKGKLPGEGYIHAGEEIIPGLLWAEYDVVLKSCAAEYNSNNKEWDLKLQWERWVLDFQGFKLKGAGLKASMLPWFATGAEDTNPFELEGLEDVALIIPLEAAKGTVITLAMHAEAIGGLDVGPEGLSPEQQAAYDQWFEAGVFTRPEQHRVDVSLVPYYRAAGREVVELADGWYVQQTADFLVGELVVEVEAPLVPHRLTTSSMSLAQGLLLAVQM